MDGEVTHRWTAEEFFGGARPPTEDDVPVTADGRVLDSPEKLIDFLDEINAQRSLRVPGA